MEIVEMDDCFYKTSGSNESVTKFFEFNWSLKEQCKKKSHEKAYQRPKKDYASTLSNYRIISKICKDELNKNGCSMRSSFIYSKLHSSLKDLNDLKPISLKDMKVNCIHYGYYLECKTIAEPFYIAGMHLLVEDKYGDIENVSLYDYNFQSYLTDPKYLVPLGTRLLIKEPNLKSFTNTEIEFGIRIDSPTDFVIFQTDEEKSTIEQLINEGNSQFQKQNYHLSIFSYTHAILKSNKTNTRALLNRSQAFIKLEKNYLAYQDAELVSQLELTNEKAFFRMGRAAYLMHQFEKAKINFETCLKLNKDNKEAKLELNKSNQRLLESQTGNYDFQTLLDQYMKKECFNFDVAEFESPKLSVVDIPNKSKGVIANKDIKKGELLVVSKAISASFKQKDIKSFSIKMDVPRKAISNNDNCENFSNILYKMQSDPRVAKQVYSLYAGPEYKRDEIVDESKIDVIRIGAIQRLNSFTIRNAFDFTQVKNEMNSIEAYNESGLWVFPALLNHSCVSDTVILYIGDIMILYAKRDIKKDEEITNKYFSGVYSNRNEISKTYNFKCDCRLCVLDKADTNLEKRQLLSMTIRNKNFASLSLIEAIDDVKKMRKLYSSRTEYKFDLVVPLQVLANKYRENAVTNAAKSKSLLQKSALVLEEIYKINVDLNAFNAIYTLKEAYDVYNDLEAKDKQKWCYDTAANHFSNNHAFFEKFWKRNEKMQ